MQFIWDRFGTNVRCCTEYVRDIHTFRCHPAFQSDNPINDWMLVKFEITNRKTKKVKEHNFPCRLAAVVIREIDDVNDEPYHLIVQSTVKKTNVKSTLLTEWLWSDTFMVIFPSSIVGPCFVISIKDDMSKVLETLPLHKWPSEFTTPVDASMHEKDGKDSD